MSIFVLGSPGPKVGKHSRCWSLKVLSARDDLALGHSVRKAAWWALEVVQPTSSLNEVVEVGGKRRTIAVDAARAPRNGTSPSFVGSILVIQLWPSLSVYHHLLSGQKRIVIFAQDEPEPAVCRLPPCRFPAFDSGHRCYPSPTSCPITSEPSFLHRTDIARFQIDVNRLESTFPAFCTQTSKG